MEEQIALSLIAKAGDRAGIKGDAFRKGARQLPWQYGNVFLNTEYIEKGKLDELDIFFFDKRDDIFLCVHGQSSCHKK